MLPVYTIIDYDPYLHRNVPNGLTNTEALVSVIKSALGTGCLAMPLAFYNSGYIIGIIETITFGCILIYAVHILMRATYVLCKHNELPTLTYRQSMEIALLQGPRYVSRLEPLIGSLVDIFQALYHFGICCVYVLFISDTLKDLIGSVINISIDIPLKFYIILITFPLILIFSIKNFLHLTPYSLAANILLGSSLFIIFVYLCYDLPYLSDREEWQNIKQLPLFYGTIAFSLESIGVLYAIEANMKTPQDFLGVYGVLNQGMCAVIFVYIMMGFYGYWHYGEKTKSNIILNLPDVVMNHFVKVFFAIGIYFSFPMQGYVTVDVVWRQFMSKDVCENWKIPLERVVRIIIVFTSVLVCVSFTEFDLIVPIVGSSCISFLGLIFPGIIDMCTRYQDGYGDYNMHLIVDILLILLGTIGGMTGTFTGLVNLYNRALSIEVK